ncbi:MAG: hypothetical protein EOP11_18835 [Proteobacteria bacterium]|nr:MAG: hypothetical protein EOP11_18835 [Pseudomonadota bacterium]
MKVIFAAFALIATATAATPAMADEFTSTAACGENRASGAKNAQFGFIETLEETKVYVDGKEIPTGGFATQNRAGIQIVTVHGENGVGDTKFDISPAAKTVQEYSVPLRGAPKRVGEPMPCKLKGFDS